jgi:hypothetical protein
MSKVECRGLLKREFSVRPKACRQRTATTHEPHDRFRVSYIPELIARKAAAETGALTGADMAFHREQLDAWEKRLEEAFAASTLPENPPVAELHEFLVELRLANSGQ